MLAAHCCDGLAMRADDFESFFRARSEALAKLIAAAMGKEVIGDLDRDAASEYEVEQDDAPAELALSSLRTSAMDS
jgi:hypothetical protein